MSETYNEKVKELKRAYQHVFAGSQGALVLADLRREAEVDETVRTENPYAVCEWVGKRNLFLRIDEMLKGEGE